MNSIKELNSGTLFFCFGPPKSGTTLLQRLLNLHPDISCPSEHQFNLILDNLNGFIAKYNDALRQVDHMTGGQGATLISSNAIRSIFRDVVLNILQDAAVDRTFIGANDNRILNNLQFFDDLFLRPKMIAIFRNPFDTAVSSWHQNKRIGDEEILRQYGGLPEWVGKTCEWYERDIRGYLDFANSRDNTVLVKYENLVAQKKDNVRELLRFLGATENEDILDDMIEKSSIENFRKTSANPKFFRKGSMDFGKDEISDELRRELTDKHRVALQFLDYAK